MAAARSLLGRLSDRLFLAGLSGFGGGFPDFSAVARSRSLDFTRLVLGHPSSWLALPFREHFGYSGLTLVSFYIYFTHLRGALGQFGFLYAVLMRIVSDFRGPNGARRPTCNREEGARSERG